MKLDRRSLVYILVFLIILRFLYIPLKKQVEEKQQIYIDKQEQLAIKEETLNRIKDLQKRKSELEASKLKTLLFSPKDTDTIIQTYLLEVVQNIAKTTKIEILSFELPFSEKKENFSTVSVLFRLKGQPRDVFWLIKQLKSGQKIIVIDSFEFSKNNDGSNFFMLKLTVYRLENES